MEVLSKEMVLLSNFEVLQVLTSNRGLTKFPNSEEFQQVIEERKNAPLPTEEDVQQNGLQLEIPPLIPPRNPSPAWDEYLPHELQGLQNMVWVREKAMDYLREQPAATQNARCVTQFVTEVKDLLGDSTLTRGELAQLVNLRPTSLAALHRVVDQCEERLSDEQSVFALQDLIVEHLPPAPFTAKEEEEQDEEEEDEAVEQRARELQEQLDSMLDAESQLPSQRDE